jgi:hypothetical protein
MRRSYALDKLGRHYEAEQSYKRARQMETASKKGLSSLNGSNRS